MPPPVIRNGLGAVLVCDGCRRSLSMPGVEEVDTSVLPPGWRYFQIDGWVGDFVACSAAHEQEVRDKVRRGRL